MTARLTHASQTLEFKDYSKGGLKATGMANRMAADVVLVIIVALYILIAVHDAYRSFQVRGVKTLWPSFEESEECHQLCH